MCTVLSIYGGEKGRVLFLKQAVHTENIVKKFDDSSFYNLKDIDRQKCNYGAHSIKHKFQFHNLCNFCTWLFPQCICINC